MIDITIADIKEQIADIISYKEPVRKRIHREIEDLQSLQLQIPIAIKTNVGLLWWRKLDKGWNLFVDETLLLECSLYVQINCLSSFEKLRAELHVRWGNIKTRISDYNYETL